MGPKVGPSHERRIDRRQSVGKGARMDKLQNGTLHCLCPPSRIVMEKEVFGASGICLILVMRLESKGFLGR